MRTTTTTMTMMMESFDDLMMACPEWSGTGTQRGTTLRKQDQRREGRQHARPRPRSLLWRGGQGVADGGSQQCWRRVQVGGASVFGTGVCVQPGRETSG